jgi:phosphomannomutase/phosphoglucomutase
LENKIQFEFDPSSGDIPMSKPNAKVVQNTWEFLRDPMISPTGFREYDARWKYPDEINLQGMTALGMGLGTQMHEAGISPIIAVANDYRDYSLAIKNALIIGLIKAGIQVKDIGTAVSPMAYFSQFHLDVPAVAMVTASHNPNGWTGVKMGFQRPLTHGPDEMARLRDIVLNGEQITRPNGGVAFFDGVKEAYIDDLCGDFKMSRKLRVVCATGNGTASAFASEVLDRIGVEVVPLHGELDYTFPNYNPNPESMEMLRDMSTCVKENGADLAVGFDGDGDRCGIVDDEAGEIFADKIGVIMAREFSKSHPNAKFVADVKSTGLFASDPVLRANGANTEYWKTGHSHMKRRVKETGALAGFEKSGHFFLAEPLGRGYDCGLRVAVELCKILDRNPDRSLSDLNRDLAKTYSSPSMSPFCPDTEKYAVLDRIIAAIKDLAAKGGSFAGQRIVDVITVNGARIMLENGGWGLVRASSNTPNLVVVCESPTSKDELHAIFSALDAIIRTEPLVGDYDQTL